MSSPADAEYDIGADDYAEQAALEPGMPDEMVAEYIEEPAPAIGFNQEFATEFSPLILATVMTMVVVEALLKPLLKALLKAWKGADRDKSSDPTMVRALAFAAGAGTSITFGFRAMVYDLTGIQISMLEAVLYGGSSVAVCATVGYILIEEMRPVKALKVIIRGVYDRAFSMIVGRSLTDDEKSELAKTANKQPPVDPDDLPPYED